MLPSVPLDALRSRAAAGAVVIAALLCVLPGSSASAEPAAGDEGGGRPLVVCLGDSLTEGYNLPPEQAFPALIEKELRSTWPRLEVVNAGVSGSTSASAVSRLQWQLRRKPDVLILALGANDGLRGIDLAITRKNLADAIDLARKHDIVVLLAGMMLPPNYGREYTTTFKEMYADLAREKNVALLPFLLEGVAGDSSKNLPDGIHPNAEGYRIVAANVARHLRPLLERLDTSAAPHVASPLAMLEQQRRAGPQTR